MKDLVCVITGATDGIGKAAAYDLAAQGATLLLHGRDPDKGAQVVEDLKAHTRNPAIQFLQADFSSLADVRRLAAAVMERAPPSTCWATMPAVSSPSGWYRKTGTS